jgi:hypothetical protein
VYERITEIGENISHYGTSANLPEARDEFRLYRTYAKANGNFKGVKKSAAKTTTDYSVLAVDGVATLTSPSIIKTEFSFPVGMTEAEQILERQKHIALLSDNDVMGELNWRQII